MTRTGNDISQNGDVKEAAKFFKWEMSRGKSAPNGIICVALDFVKPCYTLAD